METVAVDQAYILEKLRANRERLRVEFGIERIGLYGSFARNEQTDKSDIDLVYELEKGRNLVLGRKRSIFTAFLRHQFHRKLDLVDSRLYESVYRIQNGKRCDLCIVVITLVYICHYA